MKSISVCWSSDVQNEEAVQALAAIVGVITSLYHTRWPWGLIAPAVGVRPYGNWVIPALTEGEPYSSFEWYLDNSYSTAWQALNAERFLDLVVEEPWQQGSHHYDFSLVHLPLRREESPEHLPLASRPGIATVISADWVRFYESIEMQHLALRRLAFYGLGLAVGLEPHPMDASACAMRQFAGHADLLSKALDEHKHNVVYCDDHLQELLGIVLSGRGPLN